MDLIFIKGIQCRPKQEAIYPAS